MGEKASHGRLLGESVLQQKTLRISLPGSQEGRVHQTGDQAGRELILLQEAPGPDDEAAGE